MSKPRKDIILLRTVADRLRTIRKEKGVSQRIVYIDTEIHVGRIEQGRKNLTLSTLAILCDYYGITLEELFRGIKINSKDLWE